MPRRVTLAAAQLGPIQKAEGRDVAVGRMLRLMEHAHRRGVEVVVFPELALTTFFPRWYFEHQEEIDAFFERQMPGPDTQRLFDAVASKDKSLVHIEGADHYYAERPDLLPKAVAAVGGWLDERGFA